MDENFPDWQFGEMEKEQPEQAETVLQMRVRERMTELRLKPAPLATSIGRNDSFVRDLLRKGSIPNAENLDLLARALKTTADYLLGKTDIVEDEPRERLAPILGLAGAGPEGSVLFAEGQGNFGEVPGPPDAGENVAALEVRGDSMYGLANDGWLIFYEERTEPRDEYMGEPCVCWLENGHVLVKVPEPTLVPGLFNLTSTNASTMRSVAVREMALVTDIRPRRSAQRFIRRNPEREVIDVHNGPRSEA